MGEPSRTELELARKIHDDLRELHKTGLWPGGKWPEWDVPLEGVLNLPPGTMKRLGTRLIVSAGFEYVAETFRRFVDYEMGGGDKSDLMG